MFGLVLSIATVGNLVDNLVDIATVGNLVDTVDKLVLSIATDEIRTDVRLNVMK